MKGKNLIIFGLVAVGGFVGGSVFVLGKILKSERLRKTSVDILADKIKNILFDEDYRHPEYNSRVSYRNYYDSKKTECFNFEEAVFDTPIDAENILDSMRDTIKRYGVVTVADYYDLCSFRNYDYTTTRYGWTDLRNALPIRCKNGYKIKLPKVIPLN